ncbi:synaptonemal complex protein 1-like [Pocillopora verrucosa]|uniref:synaptonemal complex protein 1-like n=1 Tax=Pocillopora verrucosa TaxID=203993 RepID=UPI00333EF6F8
MASCKKKYSELRTNRKEKLSSPKKELSSNDSDVPLSNNNLMSKCNDLEQANKDLRDLIESKKSSIHTALTTIQDVQLTVKEARKRLETETGAMKANVDKIKKLRSTAEKLTEKATNCKNEINQLMTVKESSLLNFKEKNQLKEDLESQRSLPVFHGRHLGSVVMNVGKPELIFECVAVHKLLSKATNHRVFIYSEIAQLTRELEEKEEAIPNSFETEQKFKMKKTETYRTMKELSEREKEIARKGRLLKASKHEINAELELLPVECKDMERGVAERERQFSIWRVEAKMELNEKDNELEDLKTQICELKETLKSQVLLPKESNRSAKHFIPRLRRRR